MAWLQYHNSMQIKVPVTQNAKYSKFWWQINVPMAMSVLTRGKELGAKGIHLHIISTLLHSIQQKMGPNGCIPPC